MKIAQSTPSSTCCSAVGLVNLTIATLYGEGEWAAAYPSKCCGWSTSGVEQTGLRYSCFQCRYTNQTFETFFEYNFIWSQFGAKFLITPARLTSSLNGIGGTDRSSWNISGTRIAFIATTSESTSLAIGPRTIGTIKQWQMNTMNRVIVCTIINQSRRMQWSRVIIIQTVTHVTTKVHTQVCYQCNNQLWKDSRR